MDLGVLHPWLLALAIAALLPWWLSRRRAHPQTLAWGASRWLASAAQRIIPAKARQRRWTLWLRVAILLWLATALSIPRPFVANAPSKSAPQPRTWWIVILDDGPTSTAHQDEKSLLAHSLQQARTMAAQLSSVDGLSAIGTSEPTRWKILGPEGENEARSKIFDEWTSSPVAAHGFESLQSALDRIETQQTFGRRFDRIEIIVWSESNSPSWRNADTPSNKTLLAAIDKVASIRWYDVGDFRSNNLSIVKVEPSPNRVVPQRAQSLAVTLRNQDTERSLSRRLQWSIDERPSGSTLVSLAPNETRSFSIELPPLSVGEHRLQLQMEEDPLPIDSIWWNVIQADDRLPLALDGDDPRSRAILIEWAEALRRSNRGSLVSPEAVTETKATRPLLLLFGKSNVEPEVISKVDQHLGSGGVVILWCDAKMNPGDWLAALELESLPWKPAEPAWLRVSMTGQRPESLRVFEGDALSTLASTPIWKSWKPQAPLGPEWSVWLGLEPTDSQLDDTAISRPLVLARDVKRGRLVLITTPIGDATSASLAATDTPPDAWSAWALWPSFPPFVEQLVNTLVVRDDAQQYRFERDDQDRRRDTSPSPTWKPISVSPSAPARAAVENLLPQSKPTWPGLYRRTQGDLEVIEAWNLAIHATTPNESSSFATWISTPWEPLAVAPTTTTSIEPDPLPLLLSILLGLLLLETWISERRPSARESRRGSRGAMVLSESREGQP